MVKIFELVMSNEVFKLGCFVMRMVGMIIKLNLMIMWVVCGGIVNLLIYYVIIIGMVSFISLEGWKWIKFRFS